jgi:uncharacterized membrane protein YvlD (DUF360 family)
MRYVLRWLANSVCFYLAMYLVDSLIAPRFFIKAVWIAPLVAVLLAAPNSLVRPLPKVKTRPQRAVTAALITILANALVLQIFLWIRAPLSATSFVWVLVTAAFLTVLGMLVNWLIGFKPKGKPQPITRELRSARESRERDVKA